MGDKRRTARLVDVAGRLAQNSSDSFSSICEVEGALLEGTYRFIRNEAVSPGAIRRAGFDDTVEQARDISELLALENTISMGYRHQVASEFGKLGKPTTRAGDGEYSVWCCSMQEHTRLLDCLSRNGGADQTILMTQKKKKVVNGRMRLTGIGNVCRS